jgi:hypothetical protein
MVIKQMKEPPNTVSGWWFGRVVELQDFSFVWIQPKSLHTQSEIQLCKNNKKLKFEQLR